VKITLRRARQADLEWIDRMHTECMRAYVEAHYPWRPNQFRESFDPTVYHVIVVDDVDVGVVSRWYEPDAIRIGNLLVAPSHQGRGIGSAILRDVLDEARERGLGVRLRVLEGNPAIGLYERLGFTIEEEHPFAYMMKATPTREGIPAYTLRPMTPEDWPAVRAIYEEGIATRNATFETFAPDWEAWDAGHLPGCRSIADVDGAVVGWGALSPVSSRCVYGGVAEVSVYVTASAQGRGVGRALLERLVEESEQLGIWTLQAGILAENVASRALHVRCGFREIGVRERLGQLHGQWRDVVLLERRSRVVGL
jgi:L-amino acid N-acyltransferase YncA